MILSFSPNVNSFLLSEGERNEKSDDNEDGDYFVEDILASLT